MTEPKRILILTADAGFGHRSAANAVAAALEQSYGADVEVRVVNPLDDKRTPAFLRESQSDYDKIVKTMPELYKLGYDAADAALTSAIVESAVTIMLLEVMNEIIRTYRPNAILTTYPFYQAPLEHLFDINKERIPLYAAVTDLATVHRMWFNDKVDGCMVPNGEVKRLALSYGMAKAKIHVTGIPAHPNIANEKRSKRAIRQELGWSPNLTTVLAVGSRRVDKLVETLDIVNHFGAPLQVVAVAGKDEKLYNQFIGMDWHVPAHIYDYVENMPEFLKASDIIICKAGGLIVSESLASGLPMLLIDILPGQEEGNAHFVVDNEAGDLVETPIETLETLAHWMADGKKVLRQRAESAARLGRPQAAFDVADFLWRAANRPVAVRRIRHSRIRGRERFLDFFKGVDFRTLPVTNEAFIDESSNDTPSRTSTHFRTS
ncbi:MAG TPA: glycosyltransferase [Longilinea sp.]|nr:glycosyltransferase [Longilinea sp.]